MHADNIILRNELWVNRCSLELLLTLKDLCIIGLIHQALIFHKNVLQFLGGIQAVANTPVSVTHRAAACMSAQKRCE